MWQSFLYTARRIRRQWRRAAAALTAMLFAMCGLGVVPASAATATPSAPPAGPHSVLLFAASPAVPIPGSIRRSTVNFYWSGAGRPAIIRNADGTGDIFFYNKARIFTNGSGHGEYGGLSRYDRQYGNCQDMPQPPASGVAPLAAYQAPQDMTDFLNPGWNSVTVELWDTCGIEGNSDLYLWDPAVPYAPPSSPVASAVPSPVSSDSAPAPVASAPAPAPVVTPTQPPVAVLPPAGPPVAAPAPAPEPPPSTTPATCVWPKFFGVRGSGETRFDFSGYGKTVTGMWYNMIGYLPGLQLEAINYQAIPVDPLNFNYTSNYVSSVFTGYETLTNELKKFFAACPHTYVFLAGYSQGAEVVNSVFAALSDEQRRHIASVTLFGDPQFNPAQQGVNQGNYSRSLSGIDVALLGDRPITVPNGWASRFQNYCTAGDPICNYSIQYLAACNGFTAAFTCPHALYDERGYTAAAAKWAVDHFHTLPRL